MLALARYAVIFSFDSGYMTNTLLVKVAILVLRIIMQYMNKIISEISIIGKKISLSPSGSITDRLIEITKYNVKSKIRYFNGIQQFLSQAASPQPPASC